MIALVFPTSRGSIAKLLLAGWLLGGFSGCRNQADPIPPDTAPRTDVALTVVIAEGPDLAPAIEKFRGEWAELSEGTFSVVSQPLDEFLASDSAGGDLLVFPARHLGALCERDWIRPVRQRVVDQPDYEAAEVLPLLRDHEVQYGRREMALTLGSAVPVLLYNAELLAAINRPIPETWDDLHETLDALPAPAADPAGGPPIELESLAGHDAAYALLNRAVGYVMNANEASFLFDLASMEPRITSPGFERALSELRAARRLARQRVGGMAIRRVAWRMDHFPDPMKLGLSGVAVRPRTSQVYQQLDGSWRPRPAGEQPIPVLALWGRLVAVSKASRNPPAAFRLAAWLTTSDRDRAAALGTTWTAISRRSQPAVFRPWGRTSDAGPLNRQAAQAVVTMLSAPQAASIPRIPAIDSYLTALSEQVRRAADENVEPATALAEAAARWEEITQTQGRQRQIESLYRSLGLRAPRSEPSN